MNRSMVLTSKCGDVQAVQHAARWPIGILLVCLMPPALLALSVDSSLEMPSPEAAASMSTAELGDAAHHALRGGFTHTFPERSAVCAAAFEDQA